MVLSKLTSDWNDLAMGEHMRLHFNLDFPRNESGKLQTIDLNLSIVMRHKREVVGRNHLIQMEVKEFKWRSNMVPDSALSLGWFVDDLSISFTLLGSSGQIESISPKDLNTAARLGTSTQRSVSASISNAPRMRATSTTSHTQETSRLDYEIGWEEDDLKSVSLKGKLQSLGSSGNPDVSKRKVSGV